MSHSPGEVICNYLLMDDLRFCRPLLLRRHRNLVATSPSSLRQFRTIVVRFHYWWMTPWLYTSCHASAKLHKSFPFHRFTVLFKIFISRPLVKVSTRQQSYSKHPSNTNLLFKLPVKINCDFATANCSVGWFCELSILQLWLSISSVITGRLLLSGPGVC